MRSRLGKVGMLMLVLVMAVGAMGAGFAAFTDEMIVHGTVSTATVDYEVQCLSGTWVYKEMTTGFARTAIVDHLQWCVPDPQPALRPDPPYELISSAEPSWDGQMLSINFDNIFPCIDFCADVVLHYTGSIPAHIMLDDFVWTAGSELAQFLDVKFYVPGPAGGEDWVLIDPDLVQLHFCDRLMIVFCLHIPQDNDLQGMSGAFDTKLTMFQWNEADEPCEIDVLIEQGEPGAGDFCRAGGVRVKGYNTGGEIYVGPMQDASALPRSEAEYNDFNGVGVKTYSLVVSYDASEDDLTATISDPDATVVWSGGLWGCEPCCEPSGWNAMEIIVRDSRTDSGAALQNVMLNAIALGNFGLVDKAGTPGSQNWYVSGFDFSQDFTVMADLAVDGFSGNEAIKVEFNVGCVV